MTIYNNTNYTLNGWKVSMSVPSNTQIISSSSTNCTINDNYIIMTNVVYNEQILAKANTVYEIQISTLNSEYIPSNITINEDVTKPENPDESQDKTNKKANVTFNIDNYWQSGEYYYYQITSNVENIGTNIIDSWKFDINILEESNIEQIWNATYTKNDTNYTFESSLYNGNIQLNSSSNFGFIIKIKNNNNLNLIAENIILS